jgi:tol-pal system protein YbgF
MRETGKITIQSLATQLPILVLPLMLTAVCGMLQTVSAAEDLPPILESQPISQSPPLVNRKLSLEARVTRLESLLDNQTLLDMMVRLEDLQKDVQELRGTVEVQTHDLEGIKQRQRDLYLDIDRRLRQLEVAAGKGSAAASTGPATAGSAGNTPPASAGTSAPINAMTTAPPPGGQSGGNAAQIDETEQNVDSLAEQSAYQSAFNNLKEGRYKEAINEFDKFLSRYPHGQYSSNAQYWLGEANYVTRQFPAAVEEFNKVLVSYPDSNKVPDAMLKLGFSYYELSEWEQANSILNKLVENFPASTAAQLAQNRLHRMKLEGH